MKKRLCVWNCGRPTSNMTRICDACWADREAIYVARKAREAAEGVNPKRQAAARKASEAKKQARLTAELPRTALSQPIDSQVRGTY
jgi:hypothetical protein